VILDKVKTNAVFHIEFLNAVHGVEYKLVMDGPVGKAVSLGVRYDKNTLFTHSYVIP
jgi:hypothetical protein